jgi:hypothetical protein
MDGTAEPSAAADGGGQRCFAARGPSRQSQVVLPPSLSVGVSAHMNHLEQLVAEWYEYRGYFVRRNVQVGKRDKGGYDCELDVVAFHPEKQHLVHVEPSMDAHTWVKREERFAKKFSVGCSHIPALFKGIVLPWLFRSLSLACFHAAFSSAPCESALSSRASQSTKRQ